MTEVTLQNMCRCALLALAAVWALQAQEPATQPVKPARPSGPASVTTEDLEPSPALASFDPTVSAPGTASQPEAGVDPTAASAGEQTSQPYNGPGVLARGYTIEPFVNKALRFRPFFRIAGFAGNDLGSLTGINGAMHPGVSPGTEASFGITGRKLYNFDSFELDLQGDALHYSALGGYTSTNSSARLEYQHRFSSRATLELEESYGQYSANTAYLSPAVNTGIGGTSPVVTPNPQSPDARVLYLSTAADLRYERSARFSLDFGASGFETRQFDSLASGVIGAQARMDAVYRLTRRTNIGSYYSFTNYAFTSEFGGSGIHTAGLIYSYDLSRTLRFRMRAGASRAETRGIQSITLDPVIASILGTQTGLVATHSIRYLPDFTAEAERRMWRGSATLTFNHGVSAGNGSVLTSTRNTASLSYDFTGIRRYTFTTGLTYDALTSLGLNRGDVRTGYVTTGVRRVLGGGFQTDFRVDLRRYEAQTGLGQLNTFRVSAGIDWTPGERPLPIW